MCASGRRVVNIEVVVVRTSRGVRAGLMLGTGVEQWCFRSGGARKCMRTSGVERQVGNSCHPRQRRQHSPAVLAGEGGSGVEWSGGRRVDDSWRVQPATLSKAAVRRQRRQGAAVGRGCVSQVHPIGQAHQLRAGTAFRLSNPSQARTIEDDTRLPPSRIRPGAPLLACDPV